MTTPLPSQIRSGALPPPAAGGVGRPRIGIGGMSIESSTFSPHISDREAFTVRRREEIVDFYDFLGVESEMRRAAQWIPLVHARSLPGGAVDRDFYEAIKAELIASVRTEIERDGAFDGFFFDIHGAMSVVGMEDAEGDLATALRLALGPDTLVSTSMDLHGNVSTALLEAVDLLTCYRMAPHEDAMNTKERAVHNLLTRLRGDGGSNPAARRPWKAWTPVPVLLPGEKTSTRVEPAAGLYAQVPVVESDESVVDAAIWIGYAWADEPRCMGYVVVTGDDPQVARAASERLAARFWESRADFAFVAPDAEFDDALDRALSEAAPRPYVISDSGDNPTAGGAGDVTWTLARLLQRDELRTAGRTVIHASVFDPEAVATAFRAGVGNRVELTAGANVDAGPHGPVELEGIVHAVMDGDPVGGRQAVIRVGAVHAILTERRKPFHTVEDFRRLGLEPDDADVLIVKIGYLEPELYRLAADWTLALTPGGVDQNLLRLGHQHLAPGVFPFSTAGTPELKARVTKRQGQAHVEAN